MQRFLNIGLAAFIVLFFFSGPRAAAQAAPPPGPYTETCQDIQMKGDTLSARCQTSDGKWSSTKLKNARNCADGVVNLNGTLTCQAGTLPPGSYITTCTDLQLVGTTLRASCANSKGQDVATELHNANQCVGDIANKDGSLKCMPTTQKLATAEAKKEDKKDDKKEEKKKKKKKRFVIF